MEISVVIASHNEGPSLVRTIESCVESSVGADYEIVVADDGSTDGSVDEAERRFPMTRIVRHDRRLGASPAKALGARHARGDMLVFLDAHTRPEPGAIPRLARAAAELDERAIITPAITTLHADGWDTDLDQVGHGYGMDLRSFDTHWVPLEDMRPADTRLGRLYESPALIGCAFAIGRDLYDRLWGFDSHMRSWGVEDLDLGLKCWQLGHRILHDPSVLIGHRFQDSFTSYQVPPEHVLVNKLRMARKNFTQGVWAQWTEATREMNTGPLPDHPEGLWARGWELLLAGRPSLEQERVYLHAHRARDEFWYAGRFGLSWPALAGGARPGTLGFLAASPSPSGKPSPKPSPAPTPTVEIQISNTASADDDVVLLKSQNPAAQPAVSCQIRLTSNQPQPVKVVLHDPAGKLQFPDTDSVTLDLPGDQSFVPFSITGATASTAIGDCSVEARVNDLNGATAGTQRVTVASLDPVSLTLTQGGTYQLTGTTYQVMDINAAPAVSFKAQATLKPAGVNCAAPSLANIRIAFMQETSGKATIRFWTNVTVVWNAGVRNKTVIEHTTMRRSLVFAAGVPQPLNDGVRDQDFPLYSRGAAAIQAPLGCTGAAAATSNDSPDSLFPLTFSIPAVATDGSIAGNAIWQTQDHITRTQHFRTYCVVFDTASQNFIALRQSTWDLALDSSPGGMHQATVSGADDPATAVPASARPQANAAPLTGTNTQIGAPVVFHSPPPPPAPNRPAAAEPQR